MKVLFASVNFGGKYVGGGQQSVAYVARQMVQDGHQVGVMYVDTEPAPQSGDDIALLRLPTRNIYWNPKAQPNPAKRALWHLIDREAQLLAGPIGAHLDAFRPDIVHTNVMCGLTRAVWNECARRHIPVVHTVHDYYLICLSSGMRKGLENCAKPCALCHRGTASTKRSAHKAIGGVIFVSDHMQRVHNEADAFADTTLQTIIHGSFPEPAFRARHIKPGARLRLGYIGRIVRDKGVMEMLASLRDLPADSYEFLIGGLGSESYINELKAFTADMPVKFLGRVEPNGFYDQLDLLIVPSLWNDPAPRVVYESGMSGLPSIVANRGGLPQLVGHGERGWIYEPNEPQALGTIIAGLMANPQEVEAKAQAWEQARAIFTVPSVTAQTMTFYQDVLNRG